MILCEHRSSLTGLAFMFDICFYHTIVPPGLKGPHQPHHLITATNFNPREIVCLPERLRNLLRIDEPTRASILRARFWPHRVEIDLEADKPSLAVIAQSYYSCWKAQVDGNTVPVWRANYGFQAVEVPAGSHQVALIYRDHSFYGGLILSAFCLVICSLFTWRIIR